MVPGILPVDDQDLGNRTGEDFICPHCGAVYEVEYTRYPLRDSDSATCTKCKQVMKTWNDTMAPSFQLKEGQ